MIFSAQQLVSRISHDMTLLPGDLICCGTSVGVGVMKEPVNTVSVVDRRHRRADQRVPDVAGGTQNRCVPSGWLVSEYASSTTLVERPAHPFTTLLLRPVALSRFSLNSGLSRLLLYSRRSNCTAAKRNLHDHRRTQPPQPPCRWRVRPDDRGCRAPVACPWEGLAPTPSMPGGANNYRKGAPTVDRIGKGGFWMTGTVRGAGEGRRSPGSASVWAHTSEGQEQDRRVMERRSPTRTGCSVSRCRRSFRSSANRMVTSPMTAVNSKPSFYVP